MISIIESTSRPEKKYSRLKKLFGKQKLPKLTAKEKVVEILPIIKRIYVDPETPNLFSQHAQGMNIENTGNFIKFLEEISK